MLQSSQFYLCFIVWYTSNPVGHNKLGETVWRLCKEAGIQGRFTNHSLRATTATRGLLLETVRFNGINFVRANKLKAEVFM